MQTQSYGLEWLLRSIHVALSKRQVLGATVGLLISTFIVGPILFIGATIAKDNATVGDIFHWLGLILLLVLLTMWMGMLAKMSRDELNGERGDIWKAIGFTIGHLPGLLAPFALGVVGAIVALIELVLFFSGRIPTVGDIAVGCLFVPLMFINLALIAIFVVAWWLTPGIVAVEQSTFGTTLSGLTRAIQHGLPALLVFLAVAILLIAAVMAFLNGLLSTAQLITMWVASPAAGPTALAERGGVLALTRQFDPGLGIVGANSEVNLLATFIAPLDQIGVLFSNPSGRSDQTGRILGGWALALALFVARVGMASILLTLLASTATGAYLYLQELGLGTPKVRSVCVGCGRAMPAGARFCTHCGAIQPT
jgi:hypothetical protein